MRDLGPPVGLQLVARRAVGRREEGARGDRDDPDAQRREVARGDEGHGDHPALGGGVRDLPDLPLVRRDRRGVDDDAPVAVDRLLACDGRGRQAHDVEDGREVEVDGLPEAREVQGFAVLADEAAATGRAAVRVHRDPERSRRLGLGHRRLDVVLVGGVRPYVSHPQLRLERLALLVGEVGHDHLRSGRVEATDGGLAQAPRPTDHDRGTPTDLHQGYPLLQAGLCVYENSILMNITMILEMAASVAIGR